MSAVYAAKEGLLAILESATDAAVTWGYPGSLIEAEAVFMGDAEGTETASIGQVSHREEFVIPVWIVTYTLGEDAQTAEQRAWAIAGNIETAVKANPTLNAQNVTGVTVTSKTPNSYATDQGRSTSIIIAVTCRSKILQP